MQHPPNQLEWQLHRLQEVPAFARTWFRSIILRRALPFTGTAGLRFIEMTQERVEVSIANRPKVHNHMGGVHNAAINLLAETATAMVMGMNVRDDCIPQVKAMKMTFRQHATGSLRAIATLTDAQRELMQASDSGEVHVAVTVTDEAGVQPVDCEFVWTWLASSRRPGQRPQEKIEPLR